nr:uncharacterized protein LOC109193892 [Ipomoea batatas]
MENAPSPQRFSEDSDLLECSTRKRKAADGTSVTDSQSPTKTTASGSSTPEGVEFVAETPLEDAPDMAMQVEDATPIGNAPPRSYLESVVSSGSGAAPFLLTLDDAVDETSAGVAGVEQDAAMPHHGNQSAGNTIATAAARRSTPYGSWMIVTRNERRQSGRPSGTGKQTETGGRASNSGGANRASGSRYAPLEEEEVTENPQTPEQPARRADKQPAVSDSDAARHRNRSRRANVVVNEKQIENDRSTHQPSATTVTEQAPQRRMTGLGPRRAAEEDEHVVIRGEQGDRSFIQPESQMGKHRKRIRLCLRTPPQNTILTFQTISTWKGMLLWKLRIQLKRI